MSIAEKYINNNTSNRGRIRVYPDILLRASKNENGGAARLYFLAKHYDQPQGYGLISSIAFRDWIINKLKWNSGTYYRYLSEAEQLGIIERKGKKLRLAATEYAALAVDCYHIGADGLQTVKLKEFAGNNWKLHTYAAFMRRFNGKQIATGTIAKLTGIPTRTIYHYDILLKIIGGIKKTRCYGYWNEDLTPGKIAELAIDKGQHLFENCGRILRSLPGMRFIYAKVARPPKHIKKINGKLKKVSTKNGQRKRINNKLNAMAFDSSLSGGTTRDRVKLYINNPKAKDRKEEERKLRNVLIKKQLQGINTIDDVFKFEFEEYGARYCVAL